jgi:Myb-like DNA-binding domain
MEGSTAEVSSSNINNKQKRLPPTLITVDTSEKGVVAKQPSSEEKEADRNDEASKPEEQDSTTLRSSISGGNVGTASSSAAANAATAGAAAVTTSRKQNDATPASTVESESRTPKHANKASAHDGGGKGDAQYQLNAVAHAALSAYQQTQQQQHQSAFFPPRIGGHTTGAFQPAHERMSTAASYQQQQHAAAVAAHQQQQQAHHAQHQQHSSQQLHSSRLLNLQLSPGTGRYYASFAGAPSSAASRYANTGPGGYDQQSRSNLPPEYHTGATGSMPYPPQQHPAQVSGSSMYPHQQYSQQGYSSQRQAPPPPPQHSWAQPAAGSYGRPPTYPSQQQQAVLMAAAAAVANGPVGFVSNGGTFSRAVSSSFDRSIKSRNAVDSMDTSPHLAAMPHPPPGGPHPLPSAGAHHHGHSQHQHHHHHHNSHHGTDGGSVSDEGSWQQLNQIQSVDEEEMQKRLAKRTPPNEEKESNSQSNSSSLTNSPTGELEHPKKQQHKDHLPDPPKMTSSLDSLSSVASAQEPLDTSKVMMAHEKGPSPSEGSLDLMKCPSSGSAFILPSHQRHHSHLHLPPYDSAAALGSIKRGHEESRGDIETIGATKEVRKNPPAEEPRLPKKGRMETDPSSSQENKNLKASPLSIACSPPVGGVGSDVVSQTTYFRQPGNDSYYDKPPAYSYSMDSAPPLPMNPSHGAISHHDAYPPLPAHSHSSDSSTVTPMHLVGTAQDHTAQPSLGATHLPSWEIQGQESFGGGSHGGGNPLMSTFSFSQDYPMLSGSNSGGSEPPPPTAHAHAQHQRHLSNERKATTMETRNQSFDGGHYHGGSFSRAETMSFDSRSQGAPEPRQGYQGAYPPHAPSWGSAGSYPPPHQSSVRSSYPHPPPFRMPIHSANMMRAYSQDSIGGSSFQPPSEFQAPPSNLNKARNRKEILSTPYVPSKTGVFGWTKEEDMRLTDIMKKYKNPRDWTPIAKELDRNRTYVKTFIYETRLAGNFNEQY